MSRKVVMSTTDISKVDPHVLKYLKERAKRCDKSPPSKLGYIKRYLKDDSEDEKIRKKLKAYNIVTLEYKKTFLGSIKKSQSHSMLLNLSAMEILGEEPYSAVVEVDQSFLFEKKSNAGEESKLKDIVNIGKDVSVIGSDVQRKGLKGMAKVRKEVAFLKYFGVLGKIDCSTMKEFYRSHQHSLLAEHPMIDIKLNAHIEHSANFLDLHVGNQNGKLVTKVYHKPA
ncbi:unnamed protein product, partial [Didymodactylos carnosus]